MVKENTTSFDMPEEIRTFAEKSIDQARQAVDNLISVTQQAMKTARTQAVKTQSGAREVNELALRFAERNITTSFEFAQRLLQAKDATQVAALHADYVQAQIATLADQAKELSERAAKMAGQGH